MRGRIRRVRPRRSRASCPLRAPPLFLACALLAAFVPGGAAAQRARPSFALHGFGELQARTLGSNYDADQFVPSQWAYVLNLEFEADLAPDGVGPFDLVSFFSRVEVRYDCIYNGCGVAPTDRWWGNSAERAPRNLTTARTNPFTGQLEVKDSRALHRDNRLGDFKIAISALEDLVELGATGVDSTFAPLDDAWFAVKDIDASVGHGSFVLGPWNLDARIDAVGSLESIPNPTRPLPLRPAVGAPRRDGGRDPHGLFVPSDAFLRRADEFDDFEQNFSQKDLTWNHGQGQDERELKEAYLDLELFDSRLWIRAGKQSIVWGKTELFRTTDQFNPQDLALSSLPNLEESRLSLWSARGVWSFYDVGPLEDVRLELAVNFDDFEPLDLGRCGEPYTVWLVCGKTFGLWAHGFAGAGVAGELRPPDPWDHDGAQGIEVGGRVEWRWDRFSFQLSDFYGFEDAPTVDFFAPFERRVDPATGLPLDRYGQPLLPTQTPDEILRLHPGNRQLFDVVCSVTQGIAAGVIPALADDCLLDLLNSDAPILGPITPPPALGGIFAGSANGELIAGAIAGAGTSVALVELNIDPNDGPGAGFLGEDSLSRHLTDQQEALLGCGAFYDTHCDKQGIDLFNAEASVLLQSFPQFEAGGAVATRPVDGLPVIVAGARGPFDDINWNGVPDSTDPAIPARFAYDPLVDGCVGPGVPGCEAARALIDPRTGEPFRNEMAALSYNFLQFLAALGAGTGNDPDCDISDPITCAFVRGVFDIAGSTRPEVRAGGNGALGRRDFTWHGGSELAFRYFKRNVLGFAFDFAEDRTKTNWSIEATWTADQPYAVVDEARGFSRHDTYGLTISMDRPTFIRFLNPGRTFFFNTQWFLRWIDGYRQDGFVTNGPLSALGTFTVLTGYFQDRLLPSFTWVHDIRSTSGGAIAQVSYRFTNEFSATIGMAAFYGRPEPLPVALRQPLPTNLGGDFRARTRYNGLAPISERDEVFLLLRYTF
ncbi:MAG: hypothetical protein M5U32_06870 [Myxococcota bacterium]|nr:hypothetical protein [Myxococcota bacterium]